jgi:hypothetical protein
MNESLKTSNTELHCASCNEPLERSDACKIKLGREPLAYYCQRCSGELVRAIRPPRSTR